MSLFSAAERFASMDRSRVTMNGERCLHSQYMNSECTACIDICPVDAITTGKPPIFKEEACQACLACLPACPVGAFHADDAVGSLLNCITRLESESVELLCEVHPHPETGMAGSTGIRVRGCLAGLGSGAFLLLASLGGKKVIARTDACKTCKWTTLHTQIERQVSQSRLFLTGWGKADGVICSAECDAMLERPVWESTNPPLSRRDLFRMMAQQGQIAIARAAEDGHAGQVKQVGRDRLRLLNAVRNLPVEHTPMPFGLIDLDFATLEVSEACTACGVCATACPTQALHFQKTENNRNFTLTFSAPECIGCDICGNVCAPAAISMEHNPTFEDVFGSENPVVVQSGQLVRCDRCNTLMAAKPGIRLCPLCEERIKNPFGSKFPPGMKIPEQLAKPKSIK